MKIEINNPTPPITKDKPYPKHMKEIYGERIVYFIDIYEGLEIVDRYSSKSGDFFSDDWDMSAFQDLPDGFSVTLTNGE